MVETMLTTIDNPYSPFDEWDQWYQYDFMKGYHTPGLLAAITMDSSELSEADRELAIDNAIAEIVQENVTGLYMITTKEVKTF